VTGSNEQSSDDPKFALLLWFREIVFPAIEKLVGKGGKYEGCRPIFQGDNAGIEIKPLCSTTPFFLLSQKSSTFS